MFTSISPIKAITQVEAITQAEVVTCDVDITRVGDSAQAKARRQRTKELQ